MAKGHEVRISAGRRGLTAYLAVVEQDGDAWGACVPDLPGCVAVGRSRDEVERLIAEAILLHIESIWEQGEPVPAPTAVGSTRVSVTLICHLGRYKFEHRIDGCGGRHLAFRSPRVVRQTGTHRQFLHPDRLGTVTVAGKLSDEVPGVR